MTMEIWYGADWLSDDHTPENWARRKSGPDYHEIMRDLFTGAKPGPLIAHAIIGEPGARLPSYKISINTNTHWFAVYPLDEKRGPIQGASFRVASEVGSIDGGSFDDLDDAVRERRKGQLHLSNMHGPVTVGDNATLFRDLKISLDGRVWCGTRADESPQMVSDFGSWPGLDAETSWLWAPYPEFNEYEDLIERAHFALDFFLSGPDPRPTAPAVPRPEPERRAASVSIRYRSERSEPLSAQERSAIDELVDSMSVDDKIEAYLHGAKPDGTGAGLNWESFDVSDDRHAGIVFSGGTKLPDNTDDALWVGVQHWCELLTKIRHVVPDADWVVKVHGHTIVWDATKNAYDPSV